jgi:hypothetical protein
VYLHAETATGPGVMQVKEFDAPDEKVAAGLKK